MSDDPNEIPEELKRLFGIVDPALAQMELDNHRNEMMEFIDSLTDAQLDLISHMVGFKKGQDKEGWFAGIQQWSGMLYHEQMIRNRAKRFAELTTSPGEGPTSV